jgi:hypothetical protein
MDQFVVGIMCVLAALLALGLASFLYGARLVAMLPKVRCFITKSYGQGPWRSLTESVECRPGFAEPNLTDRMVALIGRRMTHIGLRWTLLLASVLLSFVIAEWYALDRPPMEWFMHNTYHGINLYSYGVFAVPSIVGVLCVPIWVFLAIGALRFVLKGREEGLTKKNIIVAAVFFTAGTAAAIVTHFTSVSMIHMLAFMSALAAVFTGLVSFSRATVSFGNSLMDIKGAVRESVGSGIMIVTALLMPFLVPFMVTHSVIFATAILLSALAVSVPFITMGTIAAFVSTACLKVLKTVVGKFWSLMMAEDIPEEDDEDAEDTQVMDMSEVIPPEGKDDDYLEIEIAVDKYGDDLKAKA